jgi:hypothetical protein
MVTIKCLNCKYVDIQEYGWKGRLGESIVACSICNEIDDEMENCEDYEENNTTDL